MVDKKKIEAVAFQICGESPKDPHSDSFKLGLSRYVELMLQVGRLEEGRPAETWLDVLLEAKPEAVKEVVVMDGKKPRCPDMYFYPAPGAFSEDCLFIHEKGSCSDCWKQKHGEFGIRSLV